jgi:hypothetical protein
MRFASKKNPHAVVSILQRARHSVICRAKHMAQRLSNDWFSQRFIDDGIQNSNISSECPLSQNFFLSHESRILQQDQALLDLLDQALADHSRVPEHLHDSVLGREPSHYVHLNSDYKKNTSFFRNHFSKRGYF